MRMNGLRHAAEQVPVNEPSKVAHSLALYFPYIRT